MMNVMDKKFISSSTLKLSSFQQVLSKENFLREILISQRRMSMDDGLGSSGPLGLLPINPFPFLQHYQGYADHYNSLIGQMTVVSNKRLTGNP
jgi:hypothetical protein